MENISEIVKKKGFKIIGISVRTSNQNNQAKEDLERLWHNFFADNIIEKTPNKLSNEIFVIYTDYKSNYSEDYNAIIGIPVSTLDEIPNGLIGREFQSENFQKFTAKGKLPNAIIEIWNHIWQKDKELNRKYSYDIEIYGENSQNGDNSEAEIFISIK